MSSKCPVCQKTVYYAERSTKDGVDYHKGCLIKVKDVDFQNQKQFYGTTALNYGGVKSEWKGDKLGLTPSMQGQQKGLEGNPTANTFCSQCGTKSTGGKFCANCGNSF